MVKRIVHTAPRMPSMVERDHCDGRSGSDGPVQSTSWTTSVLFVSSSACIVAIEYSVKVLVDMLECQDITGV